MDENWVVDGQEYLPPEMLELGDASQLTMGQIGPRIDGDAQPQPEPCEADG
jgi:hypothetical protein